MDKNKLERLEVSKDIDVYFNDILKNIIKYTKNLNLLYVEDNHDTRESTILILEEFFDNIIIANDGEDGLDKFIHNKIDIVISDINMPNMDGLLMFEKIRQINKYTYLILTTAYNKIEYHERSSFLNIEGYLLKPIGITSLLTILDKIAIQVKLKKQTEISINILKQYQNAMDENLIVSKTDCEGNITYINKKFIQTYGYSKDEILGKNHNILKDDNNPKELYTTIWDTISNKKQTWIGILSNKTKDGKLSYSKTTISPIFDMDNNIEEYIALRQDVSELI